MIFAVTGSRNWDHYDFLVTIVEIYLGGGPWSEDHLYAGDGFIHFGDCPTGADAMLLEYCKLCKVPYREHRAEWRVLGLAAGPIRNRQMLDVGDPELLLAFRKGKSSKGTDDCIKAAIAREIPVLTIEDTY